MRTQMLSVGTGARCMHRRVLWQLGTALAAAWCVSVAVAAAGATLGGDHIPTHQGDLIIHPIHHATLALGWNGLTIDVDPVGGGQRFAGLPTPDLILITHIHADHFDVPTLEAIAGPKTRFVAPPTVAERLPEAWRSRVKVLTNGEHTTELGIPIEAIPAYNLTPGRLQFHPKGRDNGYVLTLGGKRVYLSGDTEDTPELRALKNIDVAFLCMNLPYTMDVAQAAAAVRAFKPKIVYPYHYRGSNLQRFKELVGTNDGVEVRLRNWYR